MVESIHEDYEKAVKELKELNEDIFYDDFKSKITNLEITLERISEDNALQFKKETGSLIDRSNSLFRQNEKQTAEIYELFESHKETIEEQNMAFIEQERKQLLFVYEALVAKVDLFEEENKALKSDIALFAERNDVLHQTITSNNAYLKDFTESFHSDYVKHTEKVTDALDVTSRKTEAMLEEFSTQQVALFAEGNDMLDQTITSNNAYLKDFTETFNSDYVKHTEKVTDVLDVTSRETEAMLDGFSEKLVTKEEFNRLEKKSRVKMNVILAVAVVNTVLVGVYWFV